MAAGRAHGQRRERSVGGWFEPVAEQHVRYALRLTRAEAAQFIAMGPSAWHTDAERVAALLDGWREPIEATVAVSVTSYRPKAGPA